jgi:hypothetical protein
MSITGATATATAIATATAMSSAWYLDDGARPGQQLGSDCYNDGNERATEISKR